MENREKILECALELFFRRGYDAVGIQEICQSAGITKPTMYHYFGSKYGLLEQVLSSTLSGPIERLEEEVKELVRAERNMGVEERLYQFTNGLLGFVNGNYKAYMLFMSMSYSAKDSEPHRAMHPYLTRLYRMTVQLFEQSAEYLGNMNGRQEQFAIGFIGLLNHYILLLEYQKKNEGQILISEEKKRSLVHQFMHGIYS